MATSLPDKIAAAIVKQQEEIARIQADAQTNLAEARRRLAVLQQVAQALTPELEQLISALQGMGIKVLE